MTEYSDQPKETRELLEDELAYIRRRIGETIAEQLPECAINKWFIGSIYFANMLDSILGNIE